MLLLQKLTYKGNKIQVVDPSYFCSKSHYENDSPQNYLVFQPIYRFFKKIGNTSHISAWKSKGLSDEPLSLLLLLVIVLFHR